MQALMFPAAYWIWIGDFRKAQSADADASAIALNVTSPAPLIYWLLVHAQLSWLKGEEAKAFDAVSRAEARARQSGVTVLNTMLGVHRVYAALGAGDLAQADRVLHDLESDTAVEEEVR
jgi:ATP/maltotriose-dependent transcriptional regulator MalT